MEGIDSNLLQKIDQSTYISIHDRSIVVYNDHNKEEYVYTDQGVSPVKVSSAQLDKAKASGDFYFTKDGKEIPLDVIVYATGYYAYSNMKEALTFQVDGLDGRAGVGRIEHLHLDAVEHRIAGLDAGADDYLTKPFSPKELMLRVQAILKRSEAPPGAVDFAYGPFRFDKNSLKFYLANEPAELTSTEFKLLLFLCERPGKPQDRNDLLRTVWGYSDATHSRTLDTHMKRLRQKLGPHGSWVETVRGIGYRLAKSDHVAYIDADHRPPPELLTTLLADMDAMGLDGIQAGIRIEPLSFWNRAESSFLAMTMRPGVKTMIGTAPAIFRREVELVARADVEGGVPGVHVAHDAVDAVAAGRVAVALQHGAGDLFAHLVAIGGGIGDEEALIAGVAVEYRRRLAVERELIRLVGDGEAAQVGDSQIEVPVWSGAQPWGRVEFRFQPLTSTGPRGIIGTAAASATMRIPAQSANRFRIFNAFIF